MLSDRALLGRLALALIPFGLIVYVGIEGGGFDPVVFGRVGVGIWWLLLLAALAGGVGLERLGRRGLIAVGLLTAFATWTGLSMLWSESADRSAQELARASAYLAVLTGALLLRSRIGARPLLGSIAAGIAVLFAIALLNRMQPLWFPKNETLDLVFAAEARLNYPLNYWNGLAGLIAIGVPLLLLLAADAKLLAARMLSSAALPAAGLALYLTLSRGGALALALALLAQLALSPRRLPLLGVAAVGGVGAAALIAAANARPELLDGLRAGPALGQGDELMVIALVVCAAAGLVPLLAGRLATSRRLPQLPELPSLPAAGRGAVALLAVVAVVAALLVAGGPDRLSDSWEQFKETGIERDSDRLDSASGNGRYQWWSAAVDANATEPILGIGAGTFQFWWAREGTISSQVVDAHSLYLESLGELGIVGLLLIVGFVGGSLLLIVRRALAAEGDERATLVAAAAAVVAFAAIAATDWVWELPVVPIALMLIIGAALGGAPAAAERSGRPAARGRPALAALALIGALVSVPPLLGSDAVRASQERVRAGDLEGALERAEWARDVEPYGAPAALQEALVYQLQGRLPRAARAAREATELETTNWENWLILSRVERARGNRKRASRARRRARRLNPSSILFQSASGRDSRPG